MTKKHMARTFIAAALIIAALFAVKIKTGESDKAAAPAEKPLVEVCAARAIPSMDEGFRTTANIKAKETVELVSKVTGRSESVNAEKGDFVKKGAVIIKIEDAKQRAELASMRAQMSVSAAEVSASGANLSEAKKDFERYRKLKDAGYATQKDYDTRDTAVVTNRAQMEKAKAALAKANADIAVYRAELNEYALRAPIDGTVIDDYDLTAGSMIQQGQAVMKISNIEQVKAQINVPEKQAAGLRLGMKATLSAESMPDKEFEGIVTFINPFVDTDTNTVKADVMVDNRKHGYMLKPGTFVTVFIITKTVANALAVPTAAISDGHVFTVEGGRLRDVKTDAGIESGGMTQALSRLKEGDLVVTSGARGLKTGDMVQVTEQKGQTGNTEKKQQ